MIARLRDGVFPAQQAVSGTFAGVVKQTIGDVDPQRWKPLLAFLPARGIVGYDRKYRTPMNILMGLVGLVLLIACTNVAMMVQARNTSREYEFGLRRAMARGKELSSVSRYVRASYWQAPERFWDGSLRFGLRGS
jgi:hypothetical protein